MIVPLEVKIESVLRGAEEFSVDQDVREIRQLPDPPVYRVQVAAYETERELVMTWDLHTLVDSSHEPPRVGTVTHSPLEANREHLTKLRDQLNGVLAPADGAAQTREGFLAGRLLSMAQTMTELQGDEFHYLCEAAELLAETGAR